MAQPENGARLRPTRKKREGEKEGKDTVHVWFRGIDPLGMDGTRPPKIVTGGIRLALSPKL